MTALMFDNGFSTVRMYIRGRRGGETGGDWEEE